VDRAGAVAPGAGAYFRRSVSEVVYQELMEKTP